jgi:hypothetical protein
MDVPVVTRVTGTPPYTLEVVFQDGKRCVVDLEYELDGHGLYGKVFEPLKDPAVFAQAFVDEELGTICWRNGANLAPSGCMSRTRRSTGR